MMIAAAHLRYGDVLAPPCPRSDELDFDQRYNGLSDISSSSAVSVVDIQRRAASSDITGRRYVRLDTNHVRSWDNTRLIDVTQRTTS